MKLIILTICIVGYNEAKNLPKLCQSLQHFTYQKKINIRIIYCDQQSTDSSLKQLKRYPFIEIHHHAKFGYCEPSRKKIHDEEILDHDWILFLDADEEVTEKLAEEINQYISSDLYHVGRISLDIYFMGKKLSTNRQSRLFKKGSIDLTDEPHKSFNNIISDKISTLKAKLTNNDLKQHGQEISIMLEKLNRYTTKEVDTYEYIGKAKLFYQIFIKPMIWFLGFYATA